METQFGADYDHPTRVSERASAVAFFRSSFDQTIAEQTQSIDSSFVLLESAEKSTECPTVAMSTMFNGCALPECQSEYCRVCSGFCCMALVL